MSSVIPPENPRTDVPHGTVTRYANYGCRCTECVAAEQTARKRLLEDPNRVRCKEDCEDPVYQRGWCKHHFYSWRKYGDPLKAKRLFKPPHPADIGMKWCTGWCKQELPIASFSKDVNRRDGLQRLCKPCSRLAVQATLYDMTIPEIIEAMSKGCEVCSTLDDLEIDHDHDCCEGPKTCGKCVRGVLCGRHNRAEGMLRSRAEVVALLAYGDKWQSWIDTD